MTDYEQDFKLRAHQLRLRLSRDEDGTPIVRPRGRAQRIVKIAPYCGGRDEISFMTDSSRKLGVLLRRIEALVPVLDRYIGLSEARIVFPSENLSDVAREFGCEKKRQNSRLSGVAKPARPAT